MTLGPTYEVEEVERRWQAYWEEHGVYRYDQDGSGEVYSVDTPPPYVSAAHLHVGHAMSYTQAEFIVRYQRMLGRRIFYPMGFDDNGLPTERYVEKAHGIDKRKTTRSEFRALCLEETAKGAQAYEKLWRSLGLSVDWRLRYSTIDEHCRRTAQTSFLDLFEKGRIYRSDDPVLWDTHFETALAQADLETIERKGKLHDIAFHAKDGTPLVISTTRPELIPACVALYYNPEDERYKHLNGTQAKVPLVDRTVPILSDEDVDLEFGTGLMMVCTFGDGEDVRRWKRDKLETRIILGPNGKMLPEAGEDFQGLTAEQARSKIIKALTEAGNLQGSKSVPQRVSVAERSGVPAEFVMAPQWFIRVLDLKEELLKRSEEITWYPDWMKTRLDHWIEGLKYDWNISRQRFYGVPVPLWFCQACSEPVLARLENLPVDPVEDPCPVERCPKCGGSEFRGDADVLDTWMTSSLTPLINSNWAKTEGRVAGKGDSLYPMSVRVQAFEIIRTWLFYTVVKSHLHTDSLPWKSVMISGWGLNEQGKKISKRDLEKSTDATGFNRYDPYNVISRYGADALRCWATGASLGQDLKYNEKEVKLGRKLLVKLWNASRLALTMLEGVDLSNIDTSKITNQVDRWVWHHCNRALQTETESLDACEFSTARDAVDRFFWHHFCDYYLEMIKDRFWYKDVYSDADRESAQVTVALVLRRLLSMYAVFVPHVTEEIYFGSFQPTEGAVSLHVTQWPKVDESALADVAAGELVAKVVTAIRAKRSELRLSNSQRLARLTLDVPEGQTATFKAVEKELQAAARTGVIEWAAAEHATGIEDVRFAIEPAPPAPSASEG